MIQTIVATFIIALAMVTVGGINIGAGSPVLGFALVAAGTGWLGITWGTLTRELYLQHERLRLCEACLGEEDTNVE